MDDYQLTQHNLHHFWDLIQKELDEKPVLIITAKEAGTGKWGLAKMWRAWMNDTAKFMAGNGVTMPLMIAKDGTYHGERPFNSEDAHELFTSKWLGTDSQGLRLSWSRKPHDGMRVAQRGERYNALRQHEEWCIMKGISLYNPIGSEFRQIGDEQNK